MTRELHDKRAEVIALLGIDGSGKTTLAHRLVERIGARGIAAAYRKTESGRSGLDRTAQGLGYADLAALAGADPAILMEAAIGWRSLREAKALLRAPRSFVVFDRYAHCHYALSRMFAPASEPIVRGLFAKFPDPDIVFFIATPPALGAARVDTRGGNPKTLAFLEGFEQAYRALPEAARYVVLDGTASPDAILEEAWTLLAQRYPALGA